MRLKSFGCSLIYGSDLADDRQCYHRTDQPHGSANTWPSLIANQKQWQYECWARPGIGNVQILNSVLCQAAEAKDGDFFVIGWTWIERFDYILPHNNKWATVMPADQKACSKIYYQQFHSELRDKFTSLTAVKLAVDTLTQKNIGFFMTYMDELMFDTNWHTDPAVIDLQQYVKPWLHNWQGQNFVDWSRSNELAISRDNHPLEAAHQASADLFEPYIFL